MRSRIGLIIFVVFILVAAAGCSRGTAGRAGSPPAAAGAAAHSHAAPAAASEPAKTPDQRRAQFERLLGQHTLLTVRLMRGVVMAVPDFQRAATASLQENTDALSELVGSAYGSAQGERFKQLWQGHINDLLSYAKGVTGDDPSAKQAARAALLAYSDAHGAWFAEASKGRVRASDAAASVRMHVQDLMEQIDTYAAHDYARAYQIERTAYEHMFASGVSLAKGSVTPELAVGFDTPPKKLRSAFAMLLGEHLQLIVDGQRATFAGSPEFKAAGAQINANTSALAQAMGTIVGPRKGAEFQSAWADHVDGLMAYTAAVAGKDEAGKAKAEKRLNSFAVTLAAYFSSVVRNQLELVPLTGAITDHDRHLIEQVQAYAAKDYGKAQEMEAAGYQQMLGVADTLVTAIQRTVQPAMPKGGPRTGGGGTAQRAG